MMDSLIFADETRKRLVVWLAKTLDGYSSCRVSEEQMSTGCHDKDTARELARLYQDEGCEVQSGYMDVQKLLDVARREWS